MGLLRTPSFRLDGRRALVSGGNSGIGLAISTALAEAGADVVIGARRLRASEDLVELLIGAGYSAVAVELDVTDIVQGVGLVERFGGFDILVNCAGMARHKLVIDETAVDYDAVMDVNVRGSYFLCRSVGVDMIGRGVGGSIINICSQMGLVGGVKRSTYCASKHAMEGFSKAMALEWGSYGIRVNTVCPTFIRTALTESSLSDSSYSEFVLDRIALGRFGELEDVMGVVVFLASDASGLMTGSSVQLDGGWTAA